MIERKIVIGCITSTEYLTAVRKCIQPELMDIKEAELLCRWCVDYYDEYGAAPGRHIEDIYHDKIKATRIDKETAQSIEKDILPSLNQEYREQTMNWDFLIADTKRYFKGQNILSVAEDITTLLEKGDVEEAEKLITQFEAEVEDEERDDELDTSDRKALRHAIREAFEEGQEPLVNFPGAMGKFLNEAFTPGSFVAFLSPEKRGKSALKMYMALIAVQQGVPVAFFQAGDMTRSQQLVRMGQHICKKSRKEKNAGMQYMPVRDCVRNQLNICNKSIRESDIGVFEDMDESWIANEVKIDDLREAYDLNPGYKPCWNCTEWMEARLGAVFVEKKECQVLSSVKEAEKKAIQFFSRPGRRLKLATYPNDTLTINKIRKKLKQWHKKDGFKPKIIFIDYADLLDLEGKWEERHKQNKIWKGLRAISTEINGVVATSTQSDGDSYSRNRLTLKNYSEDKRKYAHVTAFYALNQDPEGREKKMGVLRLSELLMREDDFDITREVVLLQGWKFGRPIIGSYFPYVPTKPKLKHE